MRHACHVSARLVGDLTDFQKDAEEYVTRACGLYALMEERGPGDAAPSERQALRPVVEVEPEPPEPEAKYLVALTSRGTVKRLHKAKGCWRTSTCTFKDYTFLYEDVVAEEMYTHFCKDCWPSGEPFEQGGSADLDHDLVDDTSGNSSSDSSTADDV